MKKINVLFIIHFSLRFQFLPKPARGLLCQKRGAIDNNYGRQYLLEIRLQDPVFLSEVAV